MPVSFRPSDQVKGGLISDIDAVLTFIAIETDIYQNGTDSIGAVGILKTDDGEEHRALWSLGNTAQWEMTDPEDVKEGEREFKRCTQVDSTKGNTGVNENSTVAFLFREFKMAGFPENKLTDSIKCIEGTRAHWIRKAHKAVSGDDKTPLVPEKILLMPGEKGKGAAAGKGGSGTASAKPAGSTGGGKMTAEAAKENETAVGIAASACEGLKSTLSGKTFAKAIWATRKLAALSKADGFTTADTTTQDAAKIIMGDADWLRDAADITTAADGSVTIP